MSRLGVAEAAGGVTPLVLVSSGVMAPGDARGQKQGWELLFLFFVFFAVLCLLSINQESHHMQTQTSPD
jgi:hypothetical protein